MRRCRSNVALESMRHGNSKRLRRSLLAFITQLVITSCFLADAAGADLELRVAFNPVVGSQLANQRQLTIAEKLLGRFGLGTPTRLDRDGSVVFDIPPGVTPMQARELARRVEASPEVLVAAVSAGLEKRRAIEYQKAFASTAAQRTIVGVIIKYRDPRFVMLSHENGVLPDVELTRLSVVSGYTFVRSRAMSGDSFAVFLVEPIDYAAGSRLIASLEWDEFIEHVSPDEILQPHLVPNDTNFGLQWSLTNAAGGIDALHAWDISTGSSGTVIAVVDTGILPHPDFAGRIAGGYDFVSNMSRSNDASPRDTNPTDPGDWVTANYCYPGSPARTSTWHGTHVAGIIAATGNNGAGVAGVDWHARILAVRVLGKCGGDTADIVDGMRWAAGLFVPGVPANTTPARVINMSLGGRTPCWRNPAEQEAALEILTAGAAVVVSAGNSDDDAANYSPAGCFGVLTIAATGPTGDKAFYSNFSDVAVDLSAPGGDSRFTGGQILSTMASGSDSSVGNPIYAYKQGTSQAAPHVAGVIGLMLAVNPSLTIAQIRDILRGTATPFKTGSTCQQSGVCGYGLLNAREAVSTAKDLVGVRWNFSDHWYTPSENGWGIQVVSEGDIQFVTWYTYGADGSPLWFTMQLARVGQDIFAGDIYATQGTPLPNINGHQALTSVQKIGSGILFFYGNFDGALIYQIGNTVDVKPLQRLSFAAATFCYYDHGSRSGLTNYQDLWWNPAESGWGINFTHQGDTIFATWFTYGPAGQPLWLYMIANRQGPATYAGRFAMTSGIPFWQINGQQAFVSNVDVGAGTITFQSGESARFDYNVFGFSGTKMIQRQVFADPVTFCEPY